jgi:hypothetical protein
LSTGPLGTGFSSAELCPQRNPPSVKERSATGANDFDLFDLFDLFDVFDMFVGWFLRRCKKSRESC